MIPTAKVILTSDDFGLSRVYNEKILEMLKIQESLSSVSVMVKRISPEQITQLKELVNISKEKDISIGLHLELSSTNYIDEAEKQFFLFENYFGFSPDYIDIHKSSCFKGDYDLLAEYCNLQCVAFRKYPLTTKAVASPTLSILATSVEKEELERRIKNFEGNQIYEIIFHIGVYDPDSKSTLNRERELDIIKLQNVYQWIKEERMIIVNYKNLRK